MLILYCCAITGENNKQNVKVAPIMNDHVGRKSACGQEMGNNEFSWSGLKILRTVRIAGKIYIRKYIAMYYVIKP